MLARQGKAVAVQLKPQLVSSVVAMAAKGLRPTPRILVSEWADRYRVLPGEEAEPGPWRTSRTPYLKEIMDCLSPYSDVEKVVFMKAAQIGATEAGSNWIGSVIHLAPGRILQVMPTVEMAKRHSKSRIDSMVANTPALRGLVKPARARDSGNTVLAKRFPGGLLVLTGANSAVGLRSISARYIHFSEVDAYPGDVDGEGNPVLVAEERTRTFGSNRKLYLESTPSEKGASIIEAEYEASDKRRFYVPCPDCHEHQVLAWKHVKWPENEPWLAYYVCEHCGCIWEHDQKNEIVTRGEWRAERERTGSMAAGFHLNALYSPWISWGEMASEFLQAGHDPAQLKPFVNLKLGETWEEEATMQLKPDGLIARCEVYEADVPQGVHVLTAGVDVQDDRLELEIVGWGIDEESWSIGYWTLMGDPSGLVVWDDLDEVLLQPYEGVGGRGWYIQGVCVDTGGHHTLTVYNYCRDREQRRVWPIKGVDGPAKPIWPRKPSRNNKGKVNLYSIGVDAIKERVYARLKVMPPGPGTMHFPVGYSQEYFAQLTAEVQRTKYTRGRATRYWWKRDRARNEALDVRVYAYAALHGLYSAGYRLERPKHARVPTPQPVAATMTSDTETHERIPAARTRPRRVRSTYMG